jgi:hypothetical protein
MIPGAFEVRASRAVARSGVVPVSPLERNDAGSSVARERLERQREGGGAPSERRKAPHPSTMSTLRRWFFRRRGEASDDVVKPATTDEQRRLYSGR